MLEKVKVKGNGPMTEESCKERVGRKYREKCTKIGKGSKRGNGIREEIEVRVKKR